jgi:adenylate cyclase
MTRPSELIRREPKRGLSIPPWLDHLASVGIVTANPEVARRQRITNIAAFAAAGNALSHLVINALHNAGGLIVIHASNTVFALLALMIPCLHRYGENAAAAALATLVLLGNVLFVWLLGTASHLQVYFTLAGAMLLLVGTQNWKLFSIYFLLFTAALLITLSYAPVNGLIMPLDTALRDTLTGQAMINTITINAVIIFYAVAALRRAEIELENEYERSEALVTTMMPASIAMRLKAEPDQRIADRIECLSILFADLVRGARAIGRLALAMLEANGRRPPLGGQRMRLRVGLHCGPATAGVIGDMRFSYDVWGDAVNVAARMESHGVPDHIHVSEAFRTMTDGAFVFEARGTTEIKSIGLAQTFFLTSARA